MQHVRILNSWLVCKIWLVLHKLVHVCPSVNLFIYANPWYTTDPALSVKCDFVMLVLECY